METRLGKIMVGKAGGTASSESKTYKISLPSTWVTAMGFAGEGGQVLLSFDGEGITIRPKQSMEQYRASRTAQGHILKTVRDNWNRLAAECGLSRSAQEYMRPAFSLALK